MQSALGWMPVLRMQPALVLVALAAARREGGGPTQALRSMPIQPAQPLVQVGMLRTLRRQPAARRAAARREGGAPTQALRSMPTQPVQALVQVRSQ